jgi:hypothetical protein
MKYILVILVLFVFPIHGNSQNKTGYVENTKFKDYQLDTLIKSNAKKSQLKSKLKTERADKKDVPVKKRDSFWLRMLLDITTFFTGFPFFFNR